MSKRLNLEKIKQQTLHLAKISEKQRNAFLRNLVEELLFYKKEIFCANELDVKNARKIQLPSSFIERLILDEKGLQQIIRKLNFLQKLDSQIGSIIEIKTRNDGLRLKKIRVPIGVIFIIYEARPEVTIEVASLCLKSGNAAILKGGSEAIETNQAIYHCLEKALIKTKLAKETINFVKDQQRKITYWLLRQSDYIDVVIARGGYDLVRTIVSKSKIPVLAHMGGGARIYVDKSADLKKAEEIIINAKTNKPSACNSVDSVIIHKAIADKFLKQITMKLKEHKVKVLVGTEVKISDWDTEFLGLRITIKIVKTVKEAIEFINKHSKKHSEGIIAKNKAVIDYFINSVDAAALFINSSTRFHDGYEFGMGAEMGISTGKLHARGPVGLEELTSYKWIVEGDGHVRN
ncbi:glutamate-5-semialdehyde dehydrogenase [Candidatus Gottesmanbacteria bacterium RBG_16_37_8]|uniref:Gamma-glutamyl phosphate reductase n=1 Tax=Candidatus Gottesmanbacteria bacterium RBG_16_37_8 TaxID=1798371 RepID=A0A1F5YSH6_9BACT|nr:MAG: glutamate-5-semialdehyde dehydrogenase [Candidatus Gottesmanbacteria bacterium RBG_16_37_8]